MLLARAVPKGNGVGLLFLGLFVLGIAIALYIGASRHRLGRSNHPHYDTTVKWTWGYGIGTIALLCIVSGLIVIITGR